MSAGSPSIPPSESHAPPPPSRASASSAAIRASLTAIALASSAPSGDSSRGACGLSARGACSASSRSSRSSAMATEQSSCSLSGAASSASSTPTHSASGPRCSCCRSFASSHSMLARSTSLCSTRTARARVRALCSPCRLTKTSSSLGSSRCSAGRMCSPASSAAQISRQRSAPATVSVAAPASSSGSIRSASSVGHASGQSVLATAAITTLTAVRMRPWPSRSPAGSAARTQAFSASASRGQSACTKCLSTTAASCRTSTLPLGSRVSRKRQAAKPGCERSCCTRSSPAWRRAASTTRLACSASWRAANRPGGAYSTWTSACMRTWTQRERAADERRAASCARRG
jgi:hypothetical protein